MSRPQQVKRKVTVQKQKGVDTPEPAKSKEVKEVKGKAKDQQATRKTTRFWKHQSERQGKGTKLATTEERVRKLLRGKMMLERLRRRVHYKMTQLNRN